MSASDSRRALNLESIQVSRMKAALFAVLSSDLFGRGVKHELYAYTFSKSYFALFK
jgi:hypothetical protein